MIARSAPMPLKLHHLFIRVASSVCAECEVLVYTYTCGVLVYTYTCGVYGQPEARFVLLWFAGNCPGFVAGSATAPYSSPARQRRLTAWTLLRQLRAEQIDWSLRWARAGLRLLSCTATGLAESSLSAYASRHWSRSHARSCFVAYNSCN